MLFAELQQKIQQSKPLDFGQIFNESIELFKKIWVQGLISILLTIGFTIPFVVIVYLPLISLGIIDETNPGVVDDVAPILLIVMGIAYLFLTVAMSVVTIAFKAALFRIMRQKDMDSLERDDYFFFLRKPYLGKTVSVALAYLGIVLLATMLCFFPLIYVMVPMNLLIVIYAFNPEFSVSNLIKASFDLGNKKWFITFGLTFVAAFLAEIVGFLMCFIGIFATVSFVGIPLYFIYKEVIGFDASEITRIGEDSEV